jgi:2-methylfumaryl-CoA isomerase
VYKLLEGLRVVEGASFIAAPSCGLYFAQMGAEVIRFDAIGGGPDFMRWPRTADGASLYWEGLNKGKKSIAVDLARPEGRDLAVQLATAPGPNGGIFLTNYPVEGFLSHARLAALRGDIITLRVMGWPDGEAAVDYTVNCAVGLPLMTGPAALSEPVNHVLPAWDLVSGAYGAFALLAAERHRRSSGAGQEIRLALSDVAMATLGNLGQIGEVTATAADRPRMGNDLFGAFGRDFSTADGQRIMLVAITGRQWTALVRALGIGREVAALEEELAVSFERDEGLRFIHRDRLFVVVESATERKSFSELAAALNAAKVCWGPYRTLRGALADEPRFSTENSLFDMINHPSGLRYLTPGAAASFVGETRATPMAAPRLGEHTDEVLATVLGMSGQQIGRLHDLRLVAGPA